MVYYARDTWTEPSYPITGPPPKAATTVAVAHYSGSNNIPDDIVAWLRNMQRDYVNNRGYSLGYWALVDQHGDAWQIRGPHGDSSVYNSAANKGDKVNGNANDWTAPILFATTTTQPASPAAIATARHLWNQWGITDRPIPHSDLDYTACCGDPIRNQISTGQFDNPTSTPPTPPSGDDMQPTCYYTDTKLKGTFALVAGTWVPWLFEPGLPHYTGDHIYTREQVLYHQGPGAAELWRLR